MMTFEIWGRDEIYSDRILVTQSASSNSLGKLLFIPIYDDDEGRHLNHLNPMRGKSQLDLALGQTHRREWKCKTVLLSTDL